MDLKAIVQGCGRGRRRGSPLSQAMALGGGGLQLRGMGGV